VGAALCAGRPRVGRPVARTAEVYCPTEGLGGGGEGAEDDGRQESEFVFGELHVLALIVEFGANIRLWESTYKLRRRE
jgi:hypothetical protein